MSDDEISLLSDDGVEKPSVKAPPRANNPPPATNAAAPSVPTKVNKWLKAASAVAEDPVVEHAEKEEEGRLSRKKKKKKKTTKQLGEEAYAAEDEGYDEEDLEEGRMKREKAIDYLGKFRGTTRKQKDGPSTWAEVDETELKAVAENLIQNINRTQKDNILDQIFASTSNGQTSLKDPLGMGSFDTVNLRLVRGDGEEGGRDQRRLVNKWHKSKTEGGGEDGVREEGIAGGFSLPPEINPSSESFVPDLYLAQFHVETSLAQLKKGMKNLDAEMSEKGRLLKALIKNNFERFISSKDTIDDIYLKLHKMEDGQGGSTMKLLKSIEQVKATAYATWGDVLDRSVKIDRVKSVTGLLGRFNNLFGMPGRIYAHESSGDYEEIVREYNRANALIKPSSTTSRVWISLYQEVEKRVSECYSRAKKRLRDAEVTSDEVPDLVIFLAQLVAEKLPGTREEDPMRIYLAAVDDQLTMLMQDYEAELDESLFELGKKHGAALREESALASPSEKAAKALGGGSRGIKAAFHLQALDEEAVQGQGPQGDVKLLMWPGPPDWLLANVGLPRHLTPILLESLSSSAGNSNRDVSRHTSVAQFVMGSRLKRRLTPAQASWLLYLTRCNQQVTLKLAAAWSASSSQRLSSSISTGAKASRTEGGAGAGGGEWKVTEISGLARKGIERASSSCLDLIKKVTTRLGERCVEVILALQRGGPMQLSTELAIADLAHSWQQKVRSGCPMDSLNGPPSSSPSPIGLEGSLYFGLGEYARSLAVMLKEAPVLLLKQEDWRVGCKSREGQPSTSLPGRLQSIITSAMHSYSSMLAIVSKVNPTPPPADSWVPIQDGFFSSFEAYCTAARDTMLTSTSSPLETNAAKNKRDQSKQNLEDVAEEGGELEALKAGSKPVGQLGDGGKAGGREGRENLTVGQGDGFDNVLYRGSMKDVLGVDSNLEGLGSTMTPSQRGGRLLIVMSNATMLRTTILPSTVEMHRALIVGPSSGRSKGGVKAKEAAKVASDALGSLVSDLLESFIDIQEERVEEIVTSYLSPINPSVFQAATTNHWVEEDSKGQRQPRLTEGLHSIYAHLLKVHTQVFAFSPPMTMRPVWETLVESLDSSLQRGYAGLEVGSTSMGRMMDLLLDLEYLECMWTPVASGPRGGRQVRGKKDRYAPLSPSGHFEAAFSALGQAMITVAATRGPGSKGRGSMSPLDRAFQGLTLPSEAIERGRRFFGHRLLESLIEHYGHLNAKLFSSI